MHTHAHQVNVLTKQYHSVHLCVHFNMRVYQWAHKASALRVIEEDVDHSAVHVARTSPLSDCVSHEFHAEFKAGTRVSTTHSRETDQSPCCCMCRRAEAGWRRHTASGGVLLFQVKIIKGVAVLNFLLHIIPMTSFHSSEILQHFVTFVPFSSRQAVSRKGCTNLSPVPYLIVINYLVFWL